MGLRSFFNNAFCDKYTHVLSLYSRQLSKSRSLPCCNAVISTTYSNSLQNLKSQNTTPDIATTIIVCFRLNTLIQCPVFPLVFSINILQCRHPSELAREICITELFNHSRVLLVETDKANPWLQPLPVSQRQVALLKTILNICQDFSVRVGAKLDV